MLLFRLRLAHVVIFHVRLEPEPVEQYRVGLRTRRDGHELVAHGGELADLPEAIGVFFDVLGHRLFVVIKTLEVAQVQFDL